jgi:hypothetical protein
MASLLPAVRFLPISKIGQVNTPKPELPVVDEYACPGKGEIVQKVKIDKDIKMIESMPPGTTKINPSERSRAARK